jgi:hypothetical protein
LRTQKRTFLWLILQFYEAPNSKIQLPCSTRRLNFWFFICQCSCFGTAIVFFQIRRCNHNTLLHCIFKPASFEHPLEIKARIYWFTALLTESRALLAFCPVMQVLVLQLLCCVVPFWSRYWFRRRMGRRSAVSSENAPPNKRAWYGMFPQLGAQLVCCYQEELLVLDLMSKWRFYELRLENTFIAVHFSGSWVLYPIENYRNPVFWNAKRTARLRFLFTLLKSHKINLDCILLLLLLFLVFIWWPCLH